MSSEQTLYVVATPIGNIDDITARAIEVLSQVDLIFAEDTRHSTPLLRKLGIQTRLRPLHEHNEQAQIETIIGHLRDFKSAAIITDAGTPLISDPGFRVVKACRQAGIKVSPVPGACAVTAALSVSGLPTDHFEFAGFVPGKSAARRSLFQSLKHIPHTLVLFEAPHRIIDCLQAIVAEFGEHRQMSLTRELTKRFETVIYGSASTVLRTVEADADQQKGEFVLIIGGKPEVDESITWQIDRDMERTLVLLLQHLPVKTASRCAAEIHGVQKRLAYDRAVQLQGRSDG
ncbi:MAG: 16S rRNA (cytidine(1402)-2'-O)-methyltransferase [Granulosicoccus sp.]